MADNNHTLWNSMFNSAVDKLDLRHNYGGVGRYSSTEELLIDYLEKEENLAYSRECAALDF